MLGNRSDGGFQREVAWRSSVDNKEEEEMKEFYQRLIRHSQSSSRSFLAGSLSEIPGQEHMLRRYQLNVDLLDADFMICDTYNYVTTPTATVPDHFNGQVVGIYSHGLHDGYVKLFFEDGEIEFKHTDVVVHDVSLEILLQGPAVTANITDRRECNEILKRFISKGNWMAKNTLCNATVMDDRVFTVHSRYWPLEMNEWITRQRMSGLPFKSIIKQVVRYGCYFVPVSHKLSTDLNEWRVSFSKAELTIINSWTISQRSVYRTLHTLNKMIKSSKDDSKLCTYYFKTLMLWATEEKPAEFWSEHVLDSSVYELLLELMHLLERKFCPNYFIPTNNMIDHLTDTQLFAGIDALYEMSQNHHLILDVLSTSKSVETCDSRKKFYIKVPVWLYISILVQEQIDFSEDIFTRLFTKTSSALIDRAMSLELSNIYHGLCYYLMALNNLIQSDNYYLMKSIEHFHCYGDSCNSKATVVAFCSRSVAMKYIPTWFVEHKPDTSESSSLHEIYNTFMSADSCNVLNGDNNQTDEKCLLYSQSTDNVDKIMTTDVHFNDSIYGCNKTTITLYSTATIDKKTYITVQFYKEFPRMSPTVNISWFINKVYLANLYYKTRQDYRVTEEIFDNIVHVCQQSFSNQQLTEHSLPVMLSTDWTSVYDVEIQTMLGFYSLCSFMFNKTDRNNSVCIGICPVQFALYLKCHCAADQTDIERYNTFTTDAIGHLKECNKRHSVVSFLILFNVCRTQFT